VRPLFVILGSYIAGIVMGKDVWDLYGASAPAMLVPQVTASVCVAILALTNLRGKGSLPLFLVLGVSVLAGLTGAVQGMEATSLAATGSLSMSGTLKSVSLDPTGGFTMKATDGILKGTTLQCYLRVDTSHLFNGQIVHVEGDVSPYETPGNPGEFDSSLYQRARGIAGVMVVRDIWAEPPPQNPASIVQLLREKASSCLVKCTAATEASVLRGLILGEARGIPAEVLDAFRITGVYHILSVGGLHVQFALSPLRGAMRRSRGSTGGLALQVAVLVGYCLLTGMQTPVVRASFMVFLPALALPRGRHCDTKTSLAVACLGILLVWPLSLFDTGFQLSLAATSGLVLASDRISDLLRGLPGPVRDGVVPTVAAQVFSLPVMMSSGQLSMHSLVANPLVVPLSGLAILWGMVGLAVGLICGPGVGRVSLLPAAVLVDSAIAANSLVAGLPLPRVLIPKPAWLEAACYYALVLILLGVVRPRFWASPRSRPAGNAVVGLLVCALAISPLADCPAGALQIIISDTGQGDATLIRYAGHSYMVDCGPEGSSARRTLPFIVNQRLGSLDGVLITHLHEDHGGGLGPLRILTPALKVYAAPEWDRAEPEAGLMRLEQPVKTITAGDSDPFFSGAAGGPSLRVLWPVEGLSSEVTENERSVVAVLSYGRFSALLTGDAGVSTEAALLKSNIDDLPAYLLKVGHHGSKYASTAPFLSLVAPEIAVISVGKNSFGHPDGSTVQRLSAATGSADSVFRTDKDGAVSIVTDGKRVKVWAVRRKLRNGKE
jgi:competence protein ComEC